MLESQQADSNMVASKRPMSDSDCESSDETSPLTIGTVYANATYANARKKRRGLIEKRRRDRINKSLNDLKNLIPTANERQASSKLEKSEVLSLAVDHIKSLHMRENSSPQALASDYRVIGFRECMNELIAYMVNVEGLGPSDPLHTRVISHLHQHVMSVEQSHNYYYMSQQLGCPPTAASPGCYPQQICKPEPPSPTYTQEGHIDSSCYKNNKYPASPTHVMPQTQARHYEAYPPSEYSSSPPMAPADSEFQQQQHPGQQQVQYYYAPQASWV